MNNKCLHFSLINFKHMYILDYCSQLQYLGREYPGGPEKFRIKCHDSFMRNSRETDPAKVARMIDVGEFVVKELEALYSLRKYRAMKRRYYDEPEKR